jgi:predicted patatin/cPLA2 family phospholipase
MLHEKFDGKDFHTNFYYGISDMVKAKFEGVFANPEIKDDTIDGIVASAAIPVFFPHSVIRGSVYADGGALNGLDIVNGVLKCKQTVAESDIIVDTLLIMGHAREEAEAGNLKTIGMYNRYTEI